jgi:tetratricopeptide (TPR) repeat protein
MQIAEYSIDGTVLPPSGSAEHFMYPLYRVSYFIERKDPMKKMKQCFEFSRDATIPKVFVLLGMGGCGKSQLALEYCHKAEISKTYSAIFWVDATSPSTAQQSITTIAEAMSKPAFDIADDEGNLKFVRDIIKTYRGRWLFIFDNFDDPGSFRDKNIKEFFPQRGQGSILVTARHVAATSLSRLDDHYEMSTMSDNEALELLFQRARVTNSQANIQEGKNIVQRLGYHALAIDQAGAYISARNLGIDLYLKHFTDRGEEVLNETPDLWDYGKRLKDSPEAITKLTVLTTWKLSFDLITGDNSARNDKEHVLNLMAFFNSKAMSDELFQLYGSQNIEWMTSCVKNKTWDVYKFQDILRELRNFSLLQHLRIDSSGTSFSLHPLIQDCVKLRLDSESRRLYTTEAIMVLSTFLRIQNTHKMGFETKQAILTQLSTAWLNKEEYLSRDNDLVDTNLLDAFNRFASFSSSQGKYDEAEPMYRETLELTEKALGKEHPQTLVSMNNLASLLARQGKYDEAEPMYRETLELTEKALGKEHPHTLVSMNNLAYLLESQGKYDEAEPMYRETLKLTEKALGKEHPQTLVSMNNLASLLERQGK